MLDDPAANAASLQRWMAGHPERREIYKRVAVEVGFASDAASELPFLRAAASRRETASRRKLSPVFMAAGLTTALVLISLLGWRIIASQRPASVTTEIAMLHSTDQPKAFRLPDGSTVTLFGQSKAALRFSAGERAIVLDQGRARFAVAHDASRPFVVYVHGGAVTAVGTVFEVDAQSRVLVQLLKGRVVVTLPKQAGEQRRRQITLDPGQQLAFPQPADKEATATQSTQQSSAMAAIKSYDDVSVADIVAEANAQSQTKIILSDRAIGQEKVFAELDTSDAESVAIKLAIILRLDIQRPGLDQLRLIRRR